MKYICTNIKKDGLQCGGENIHRAMFCLWDEESEKWSPKYGEVVFPEMEYWCLDCDADTQPEEIGELNQTPQPQRPTDWLNWTG